MFQVWFRGTEKLWALRVLHCFGARVEAYGCHFFWALLALGAALLTQDDLAAMHGGGLVELPGHLKPETGL